MSFSSEQKAEIMNQPPKNSCCKHSMLNGIMYTKGELLENFVSISLENDGICSFVSTLVLDVYGKDTEIFVPEEGGRRKILRFFSPSAIKFLDECNKPSVQLYSKKCKECRAAFLRGAFLASGRVSDPNKQYRVEFSPMSNINGLRDMLTSLYLDFSLAEQKGKKIIYTGNSTCAEDFFVNAGMNYTAYFIMNAKAERGLKNTVNRQINCETNNISKSVSASAKHSESIEALQNANLLSSLPEELEETARMRLKYRDYSLTRLAALFSPPISKSGLSHRLAKIVELAEELLKNRKK